MTVDVIIPTYKPDETFCLLLRKLQEQTFVVHGVIILNTDEKYWTEACKKYPVKESLAQLKCSKVILHVAKEEFDHGKTRHLGVENSEAEIVLFMTQDAVPADEFMVENLVQPFLQENDRTKADDTKTVVVAYARQLPNDKCHITERYTRQFNYPEESRIKTLADIDTLGIKTFFCSDVCAAYDKELYMKLGGFEYPVIFNEDMFFAANAVYKGYKVCYAANARVVHSHNYSVKQQFHRNFDLAVSQTMHPEIFEKIKSEKEGVKLVKNTVSYLWKIHKPWLIIPFGMQCIGKYAGYRLGKRHQCLSRKKILKYTMNPGYWENVWRQEVENENAI